MHLEVNRTKCKVVDTEGRDETHSDLRSSDLSGWSKYKRTRTAGRNNAFGAVLGTPDGGQAMRKQTDLDWWGATPPYNLKKPTTMPWANS
jgi:hypothetical protein